MGAPDRSTDGGITSQGAVSRDLTVTNLAIDAAVQELDIAADDPRSLALDRLRGALARRAIEQLEGVLRDGRDLAALDGELILMAEDVPDALATSSRTCRFKRLDAHGLWCTADVSGTPAPTSEPICLVCTLPEEPVRCSALTHPRIQEVRTFGGVSRIAAGALCNAGHDDRLGDLSLCRPGGNSCWRKDITMSAIDGEQPRAAPGTDRTGASVGRAPWVFLSYSHADKPLAQQITAGLKDAGYRVWIDEVELVIGVSLVRRIAEGVHETDYLVALVSASSVDSSWCQKELALALARGLGEGRYVVLPVRVGEIEMPPELGDTFYGTAGTGDPSAVIADLCAAIAEHERRRTGLSDLTPSD